MVMKPGLYGIIGFISLCIVIFSFYFINNDKVTSATQKENRQMETILFSNNQYLSSEENYYNALLEIKQKYPKEVNSFQIIFQNENEEIIKRYQIVKYPTLLILDNDKVLVKLEGNISKDNIFKEIESVYKK
jgi:hypothetical protein